MSVVNENSRSVRLKTVGSLPPRMRVLYITTAHRTGSWLAEALACDNASNVQLEEAVGTAAGLAQLRDQVYDAVLVSHEPSELDALDLVEGLRAGGAEEPLIVLGVANDDHLTAMCYEVGGDAYLCVDSVTTRTLLWTLARAIERHSLLRETRRLNQLDRQRLQQEHQEAERLLAEQRVVLRNLEASAPSSADDVHAQMAGVPFSSKLLTHYRELLRAHVIMGSGNLAAEMNSLGEMLTTSQISSSQTLQLHLQVVEEMIRGLGNRSARHVMIRADLLIVEVLAHLAEGYRRRLDDRCHPPRQLPLPGFDEAVAGAKS
jgi:DNA-binding response OmpR family regulator